MNKTDRHKDDALRMALLREQSRLRMPEDLTQRVMARIERPAADDVSSRYRLILRWTLGAAAAVALTAFVLAPQMRTARLQARYEGSYVIHHGVRVDNLRDIQADIAEAVTMADAAERMMNE